MNIGIIIGRIGGVDGVALETEKWIEVLEKMGHEIYVVSGEFENWNRDPEKSTLVVEMSFFSPEGYWEQKKSFLKPDQDIHDLQYHINLYSKVIYERLLNWVRDKKIELLISENASALPLHLIMGLATKKLVHKTGLPTIAHDHDFAWERGNRYISPYQEINDIINDAFPLRLPNVIHAVINTPAQQTLKDRYNLDSIMVPNVMNFDIPYGMKTQENMTLPKDIGCQDDDILIFQVTRIVKRKGIETAIELVEKLQDKRIKLVITGDHKDETDNNYYDELVDLANKLNVPDQVIFASEIITNKGYDTADQVKYSLADAYAHAQAATYFSTYEGFGNAFVEAVLSKTPIFVNNYKPVYWPDIGSKGFRTVMLENNVITQKAVDDAKEILYNPELNKEIAQYNFELGKKHFSYDTLQNKLEEIIQKITGK